MPKTKLLTFSINSRGKTSVTFLSLLWMKQKAPVQKLQYLKASLEREAAIANIELNELDYEAAWTVLIFQLHYDNKRDNVVLLASQRWRN